MKIKTAFGGFISRLLLLGALATFGVTAALLGAISTNAQSTFPVSGLTAYYPLDGNTLDASGNGRHGIANNGAAPTFDRFGVSNGAYMFDGVYDNIAIGAGLFSPNALTIALWFQQSSVPTVLKWRDLVAGDCGTVLLTLDYYQNRPAFGGQCDAPFGMTNAPRVTDTNWHHVAATYGSGQVKIYVDGILVSTSSRGGNFNTGMALYIGAYSAGGAEAFAGSIDDVFLYNRALTQSEVTQLAAPNSPPTADAGGPYGGEFGSAIGTSGAGASDPDTGDTLTYAWTVNSASCSFDDASLLNPSLTCTDTGNFTATLEVSDGVNPAVSSDAAVMVNKAATTTTVTCAAGPFTYTGAAQTPCSATVTGAGGLNLTPTPDYANNTNAGTANASYTYAESANYLGSSDSENFTINKAGLNVTPDAQQILIGSPDPTFTFSYAGFVNSENPGVVDTAPTCGVTGPHAGVGSYTITCSGGVDNNYSFTYGTATLKVVYNFNGFFNPIDNLNQNTVKAGQGIPVKFSLNGNFGLNILAAGYPVSYQVPCSGTGDTGEEIPTVTAGNSSLSYDATTDQYNYVWKTDKSWIGTCRVLVVGLNDGSSHTASFKFK